MGSGESYFGLNLVSLVGLVMTALGLTFARQAPNRRTLAIAVMGVGTALVFLGFWLGGKPP